LAADAHPLAVAVVAEEVLIVIVVLNKAAKAAFV
jgi:hypothetical protein